ETATTRVPASRSNARMAANPTRPEAPAINTVFVMPAMMTPRTGDMKRAREVGRRLRRPDKIAVVYSTSASRVPELATGSKRGVSVRSAGPAEAIVHADQSNLHPVRDAIGIGIGKSALRGCAAIVRQGHIAVAEVDVIVLADDGPVG